MSASNLQTNPNALAPKMPDEWYHKAVSIFKIPSTSYNETSMSIYIIKELEKMKDVTYYLDDYSNIIITKGKSELYPCFCAHLDTVHTYPNGFKLLRQNMDGRMYLFAANKDNKSVGIGGDDKCGIFVCMYLLERLECVKIIFFSQEESGGIGSSNIELSVFDNCQFLGGIDRWNGHDFVNKYSGQHTVSKAFKKRIHPILKKYGFIMASGLFTDAFNVIERDINISCFNLSCGYYSHHSANEYVDLNELYLSCLVCEELSTSLSNQKYEYKYNNKFYGGGINYADRWNYADWDYTASGRHKDEDGMYKQGAATTIHNYKSKIYNYKDEDKPNTMPETEEEFLIDGVPCCQNCGIELIGNERKYCSTCKSWMEPSYNSNTDIPI
jgi:hypothetical protein